MENWLDRTRLLIGGSALEKLTAAHVAVFGLGGVGSWAAEALARAGIGGIDLVDHDRVTPTNINRQLVALRSTVGRFKTEVMAERIADINPNCAVAARNEFFNAQTADGFDLASYSYVIDAIDTVTSKLLLAELCAAAETPLISSMGTGNKLDPTLFRVNDIYDTSVCPLARVMRKELKKRGIAHLEVVWSPEEPRKNDTDTPGTVPFVPSAAGLLLAGTVIRRLAGV